MTAPTSAGKPLASLSFDLDNLWSYLKTYGDPSWTSLPTYIPVVVPRLLELLDRFAVHSTVFVVGQDTGADVNLGPLADIAAAGHEIGNHSWSHEPWLHTLTRQRIADELCRTEEALATVTGQRPQGFRAPGYSVSPSLFAALAELGYRYDASTLPTWIGPVARVYYFRTATLTEEERERRRRLFGRARDGLLPLRPHWCRAGVGSVLEIPVTTIPVLRVPMHFSYVLYLHSKSPRLARTYFRTGLSACRLRGLQPSLLMHPLDLLDGRDAPGVGFFPGMAQPAAEKLRVITWCLSELSTRFRVVGVGRHAEALAGQPLPWRGSHG